MEVEVSLEFDCCQCQQPVRVTLKCEGKSLLTGGLRTVASVKVPCPGCTKVNVLYFEPGSGCLHKVCSESTLRPRLEPSLN